MPLSPLQRATPLAREFTHINPTISSAYNICFTAENYVDRNTGHFPNEKTRRETLVNIRILGYMLTRFSADSDGVSAAVARSIHSLSRLPSPSVDRVEGGPDIAALNELGQFYRDFFLRPCE